MVEKLFKELSELPQVEAIALGGSRSGTEYDEKSDYDVYLYCTEDIGAEIRRNILSKYCSYIELNNSYWEREDNCTLNSGVDIDLLYRNLDGFVSGVASVVENFEAHNGYTTCMWHNLNTCKIIFDRNGRLTKAKARFDVSYPEKLKQNIIKRNLNLIHNALPAYDAQIKKAVTRNDRVSINHRTAAFLESYFDIIFAYNYLTHPGEKRLVQLCKRNCKKLPTDFEKNIDALFDDMFTNPELIAGDLKRIVDRLNELLNS